MKYFFTILLTTSLISIKVLSQSGLEGIVVEKYYISDSADSINANDQGATYPLAIGSTTYRVYANLLPGYRIGSIWGNASHTLNFSTSTSFYNDPNYSVSTYLGTSVTNTRKHTTLIDSYITIGAVAAGKMGVLKTEDTDGTIGNIQGILANNTLEMGSPIMGTEGKDGLMPGTPVLPNILGLTTELDIFDQTPGNEFTCNNCAIAALVGVSGVTPSNHVLLGQFTTDGVFSFKLNLQILDTIPGNATMYVSDSVISGEFTFLTIFEPTLVYSSDQSTGNNYTDEITICDSSYTWIDGITYTSSNNTATFLSGDTLISLDLTIGATPNSAIVSLLDGTLTATGGGAGLGLWVNCANQTPVAGASGTSFSPSINGLYTYVIVDQTMSCYGIGNCVLVDNVGISESKEFQVTIAPNPNDGLFVLNNPASFSLPFSIFDITGKLIYTSKIESSEMSIDIQNLDAGLYTILVAFEDRIQALRFIKN